MDFTEVHEFELLYSTRLAHDRATRCLRCFSLNGSHSAVLKPEDLPFEPDVRCPVRTKTAGRERHSSVLPKCRDAGIARRRGSPSAYRTDSYADSALRPAPRIPVRNSQHQAQRKDVPSDKMPHCIAAKCCNAKARTNKLTRQEAFAPQYKALYDDCPPVCPLLRDRNVAEFGLDGQEGSSSFVEEILAVRRTLAHVNDLLSCSPNVEPSFHLGDRDVLQERELTMDAFLLSFGSAHLPSEVLDQITDSLNKDSSIALTPETQPPAAFPASRTTVCCGRGKVSMHQLHTTEEPPGINYTTVRQSEPRPEGRRSQVSPSAPDLNIRECVFEYNENTAKHCGLSSEGVETFSCFGEPLPKRVPLAEKAPFSKLSAGLLRLQENAFSPVELPLTLNSVKQASECQLEPDHIPLRKPNISEDFAVDHRSPLQVPRSPQDQTFEKHFLSQSPKAKCSSFPKSTRLEHFSEGIRTVFLHSGVGNMFTCPPEKLPELSLACVKTYLVDRLRLLLSSPPQLYRRSRSVSDAAHLEGSQLDAYAVGCASDDEHNDEHNARCSIHFAALGSTRNTYFDGNRKRFAFFWRRRLLALCATEDAELLPYGNCISNARTGSAHRRSATKDCSDSHTALRLVTPHPNILPPQVQVLDPATSGLQLLPALNDKEVSQESFPAMDAAPPLTAKNVSNGNSVATSSFVNFTQMENTAADSSISRWNFCTRGAPDAGDMEKEANAALLSTGWATRIRYTDLREIETAFPSRLDDSSMSSGKSSPWSQESGDEPLIASQQRRQFFNTARRTPGLPPSFLRRVEPSRHRFSVKDSSSVSRAGLLGEFRGILRRKVEQCSILSKQTQLRAAMQSRSISRCNHLRSVRSVKSSIRDRIDNLPLRLRGSLALGERRVVLSPPALRTTGGGSQASKKTRTFIVLSPAAATSVTNTVDIASGNIPHVLAQLTALAETRTDIVALEVSDKCRVFWLLSRLLQLHNRELIDPNHFNPHAVCFESFFDGYPVPTNIPITALSALDRCLVLCLKPADTAPRGRLLSDVRRLKFTPSTPQCDLVQRPPLDAFVFDEYSTSFAMSLRCNVAVVAVNDDVYVKKKDRQFFPCRLMVDGTRLYHYIEPSLSSEETEDVDTPDTASHLTEETLLLPPTSLSQNINFSLANSDDDNGAVVNHETRFVEARQRRASFYASKRPENAKFSSFAKPGPSRHRQVKPPVISSRLHKVSPTHPSLAMSPQTTSAHRSFPSLSDDAPAMPLNPVTLPPDFPTSLTDSFSVFLEGRFSPRDEHLIPKEISVAHIACIALDPFHINQFRIAFRVPTAALPRYDKQYRMPSGRSKTREEKDLESFVSRSLSFLDSLTDPSSNVSELIVYQAKPQAAAVSPDQPTTACLTLSYVAENGIVCAELCARLRFLLLQLPTDQPDANPSSYPSSCYPSSSHPPSSYPPSLA